MALAIRSGFLFFFYFFIICVLSAIHLHVLQFHEYILLPPVMQVLLPLLIRGKYLFRRVLQTFCIFPMPVSSLSRFQARTEVQPSEPDSNQCSRTVLHKYDSVSAIRLLFRRTAYSPDPDTDGTFSPILTMLHFSPAVSFPDAHILLPGNGLQDSHTE